MTVISVDHARAQRQHGRLRQESVRRAKAGRACPRGQRYVLPARHLPSPLLPCPLPPRTLIRRPDFADYARAPPPAPPAAPSIPVPAGGANLAAPTPLPYTKWYRVWERASPGDFVLEAYVLPFALLILLFHVWGRRANRARARGWMAAHRPLLEQEYALVGFGAEAAQRAVRQALESVESEGLAKAMAREQEEAAAAAAGKGGEDAVERLKERAADDFETYATGRQNVACVDVRVTLLKRYNPLQLGAEYALAALFESFRAPAERATATAYAFDGHEKDMVPGDAPPPKGKGGNSSYDGFVWALVHKEQMRALRDERYDISLTATKDHAKLPAWATVMSESAEVTDALLTPELVAAVEQAGPDRFEHLIVSDQPLDKPTKSVTSPPADVVHRTLTAAGSTTWTPASASPSPCACPRATAPPRTKRPSRSSPTSCGCRTCWSRGRTSAPRCRSGCARRARRARAGCGARPRRRRPRSARPRRTARRRPSATPGSRA